MKPLRRSGLRLATLLGCFAVALGLAVTPRVADARVVVGVEVPLGVPYGWYGPPPPYVYPPPAYGYLPPPPVYVAPPVQYVLPPVPSGPPPAQYWYYCSNPQGYYPYIAACPSGWRAVQPKPVQ